MDGGLTRLRDSVERARGRLVVLIVLAVGLYFVVAFGEQAWRARTLQAEIAGRREALAAMQARHDELAWQLVRYRSDYESYVERVARRDLNLARPGETVLLLRLRPAPTPTPTPTPAPGQRTTTEPSWRAWLDLFGLP
ncbi:MAG: septum formation initiator family protein [Sphaerobacter sp.]|nr:septum formation initiator family protein [Sphaerobacter sp.]